MSKVTVEEGRFVPSLRPLLLLPLVLAAVLLPGSAQSAATATQLNVTVGPGFSIKVADANGSTVSHLDPGDYSITIKNLSPSSEHNFHLTGPGVNMASAFDNVTVTWNVTLVDGALQVPVRRAPDDHEGLVPRRRCAAAAARAEEADGQGRPEEGDLAEEGRERGQVAGRGKYKVAVSDLTKADNFHLSGPGVNKKTGVKFKGSTSWTVTLKPGKYTFRSDATKKLRRTFSVG